MSKTSSLAMERDAQEKCDIERLRTICAALPEGHLLEARRRELERLELRLDERAERDLISD